jgi:LmbE family N-acetylglucosaminyl deacetylase
MKKENNKILVVAAHPDDEILGCGGTMALHSMKGDEVYVLILGEGITSRSETNDRIKSKKELNDLKKQMLKANKIIGVKKVFAFDFPDNRFDTVPLLDVIKYVERIKREINPNIVFTHHYGDLNIDHVITHRAVMTAFRPVMGEDAREIYTFEVPSSTEWNYPLSFSPDVFFDISDTLDLKLKAMAVYKSEIRDYPHPRSLEGIRNNAEIWGMKVGLRYAEAFKLVRIIR